MCFEAHFFFTPIRIFVSVYVHGRPHAYGHTYTKVYVHVYTHLYVLFMMHVDALVHVHG